MVLGDNCIKFCSLIAYFLVFFLFLKVLKIAKNMNLEEYFIEVKPQEFQQFLRNLLQNSQNWAVFCSNLQIFMSFFGVFFNILHIFILLNKSMRRQATNVLIIGIAISDIFYLFYYVEGGTREFLENGIPGKWLVFWCIFGRKFVKKYKKPVSCF